MYLYEDCILIQNLYEALIKHLLSEIKLAYEVN